MIVFIDSDYKCHPSNDGTMRGFDVPFLDGKCSAYIEGCRYVPDGETWTTEDGVVCTGEMLTMWKDSRELERVQAEYEHEQLEQLKAELSDADAALTELGVNVNG